MQVGLGEFEAPGAESVEGCVMARRVANPDPWVPPSRAKYPWDEWLDGSRWVVTAEDMQRGTLESFRHYLWKVAGGRGLEVKSRFVGCDPATGDPLAVEFQVVADV